MPPWFAIACVFFISLALLWISKKILIKKLKTLTDSTSFQVDSVFVAAVKTPLNLIFLVVLIHIFQTMLQYYDIRSDRLGEIVSIIAQVLLILAVVMFIERVSTGGLQRYSQSSELIKNSHSILKGFTRLFIIGIGALVLMGTLGISITPIIASLGITSLAVALALRPTLENFFSGVQLIADKPIRIGDFIELDSGEQGFVEKIGWRSTWIKMLPNNIVIMPNSVLSQSKLINYYYPTKELSVPVDVGVHYDSDLEHVERVTLEVAREILKSHKWGIAEYETFVVFHTFDSSSINFTVMLRAQEYFNRFFIKSEFMKALHKRYREEGIIIPYPIRAINTSQEAPRFETLDTSGS